MSTFANMIPYANGNSSQLSVTRGVLKEYTNSGSPLELNFEFNPTSISRSREVELAPPGKAQATIGGRDFKDTKETARATQGATVKAESLTVKILLDATDRMNAGDPEAQSKGIQPELDILCYMIEPKLQKPGGATTLAALGAGDSAGQPFPSVLLFVWGTQELPVLMTKAQFDVKEYFPNLVPYRAEVTLTLQVIQSNNKYYNKEINRMVTSVQQAGGAVQGYQKMPGND
ncbi:MAG TPA: hypothetical protein VNI58_06030 [Mariprofundaceae bacterium]|nr:hypothetical protein [Mariprofundaceae bacterium]